MKKEEKEGRDRRMVLIEEGSGKRREKCGRKEEGRSMNGRTIQEQKHIYKKITQLRTRFITCDESAADDRCCCLNN